MLGVVIRNGEVFTSREEKKLAIASSYYWFLTAPNNPFFQAPPSKSVYESVYYYVQTIVKLMKIYENIKCSFCHFCRRHLAFQTISRRTGSLVYKTGAPSY